MQDTAEGFGQPIRQIFEPFFRMERQLPSPFDAAAALPRRRSSDHFWHWLYLPIARSSQRVARLVGLLQQGRIAVYLTLQLPDADRAAVFVLMSVDRDPVAAACRSRSRCCSRRCSSAGSTSAAPGCRTSARPALLAALPDDPQAVQQGRGARRRTPRRCSAPRRTSSSAHVLRRGDRPVARDRPAVRAGRRRDRAGRACSRWRACSSRSRRWTSAPRSARSARGAKC